MKKIEEVNIVKIGSDSINDKNLKKLIWDSIYWKEKTWEKFIFISSGSVKLWKERILDIWKELNNFSSSSIASIWQKFLMQKYWKFLWKKELIWEVLIDDYANEKHLSDTLNNLLNNDVWIVINHNDTLHSIELDNVCGKNDNDKNTVFVARLFDGYLKEKIIVKNVVYLTNTNWLLDENGNTVSGWNMDWVERDKNYYRSFVEESKSNSWTGWMKSKLDCSFEVLNYWVEEAIITNAKNWLDCFKKLGNYTSFYKNK